MNNLLSTNNAADVRAIVETNAQRIDASPAFGLYPSLDLTGNPTALMGPPVNGAWVVGQFWVDAQLAIFRCTASGSPGAWIQQTPAVVAIAPAAPVPLNYLIQIPAQRWAQLYWDGNQWQPVFIKTQGADSTETTADTTTKPQTKVNQYEPQKNPPSRLSCRGPRCPGNHHSQWHPTNHRHWHDCQ